MTPEIGFVVFLALLVGPTALWLVYRGSVSHSNRVPGGLTAEAGTTPPVVALAGDGEWACPACRSVNRPGAKRCYSCRTAREEVATPDAGPGPKTAAPVVRPVPVQAPAARPIPVRATDARPIPVAVAPAPPVAVPIDASTVATGAVAAGTVASVAASRSPAARSTSARGTAARATAARGTASRDTVAPAVAAAGADPVSPAVTPAVAPAVAAAVTAAVTPGDAAEPVAPGPAVALPEPDAPPVCPFIGLRDDPTTRLDFPDSRNLCHAVTSRGVRAWLGGGPEPIDAGHQAALCLTASHRQCARYPVKEPSAPHP